MSTKDLIRELSSLGSILKMLAPDDVSDAHLAAAAGTLEPGQLIGGRLVQMRVIEIEQLDRALRVQERFRAARSIDEVNDILDEVRAQAERARADLFEATPPTNAGQGEAA